MLVVTSGFPMALTVDEFLEKIGSFKQFQWILLGIFGYVMIIGSTFPTLIVTFLTTEPEWICVKNSSICNFTEPIGLTSDDYEARCDMPREEWKYVDGMTSTVTEFDLVCDRSYLLVVAQSCSWGGMLIALFLGGYLGDRLGRKIIYYFPLAGVVLATWLIIFPKHFLVFIAGRTFIGMCAGVLDVSSFVTLTEFTNARHRSKIGVYSFNFWVAGYVILALMGYLLPYWRNLLLASAIISTPALGVWWFIPQSVRWLLLKNKYEQAMKQLAKVAKVNKKEMPKEEVIKPEVEQEGSFRHLFINWETTKNALINWDVWMGASLVYYGVSYGSVDLGWNPYLTFALTGAIELPAYFATVWVSERYGRKKATALSLVFACICLTAAVMIPYEESGKASINIISRIILAVFAKFFLALAYACVYVWTVEMFPTFIRSMALSSGAAAAIVGSICSNYIIWLIRVHTVLPFGIMAFICLQSSFAAMFLPETNGQATLETMKDMGEPSPPSLNKKDQNTCDSNEKFEL